MVAFDRVIVLEHKAVVGGLKCLYRITKRKQAHHTNYPLLDLAELLGCNYFEKLKVNGQQYTIVQFLMLTVLLRNITIN